MTPEFPSDLVTTATKAATTAQSCSTARRVRDLIKASRLSIDVDVANGTFWIADMLHQSALLVSGRDIGDLVVSVQKMGEKGKYGLGLKKFRKVRVIAKHRGRQNEDEYRIERFIHQDANQSKVHGQQNQDGYCIEHFIYQDANQYKVQVTDLQGNDVTMSLYDYFAKK